MDEVLDVSTIMDSYPEETDPLIQKKDSGTIRTFDDALDSQGVGLFHIVLILVAGWALASDSVEVQCVSFVTPQLSDQFANPDTALSPTDFQKGLLDAIIFVGMMVGGYFWGSWSDVVGRRSCLITSLTFNGVFGLASAFSPDYYTFLFFRFMSGVGVGGSLPVAFSYFCEFFSKRTRGPFVIVLAGFWILGSVFASLLALAIIEPLKDSLVDIRAGGIHITSWRVYIMLCTFPALSAAVCLICLPESPSFLFTKGKLRRTLSALRRVRTVNNLSCFCFPPTRGGPLTSDDLSTIPTKKEQKEPLCRKVASVLEATVKLFSWSHVRASVVLCTVWFTFSFGYYGLFLWFPEYFKKMQPVLNDTTINSSNSSNAIYIDSVYTSLAAVPATILGIFLVNLLGGKIMLTSSICLCAVSSFLIRVVPPRERNIVILSSVFNGIATFGWNALDIISTSDIFPVELRSTAFGIQAVFGRIGAIVGNVMFGQLVSLDPMIPIVLVAALLLFGGIVAIFMPSPPGESELHKFKKWRRKCHHCLCCPVRRIYVGHND